MKITHLPEDGKNFIPYEVLEKRSTLTMES